MAYEVTATRRRPQRFEDLVGQDFVAATLKNSIQSGKIAHAYLFSGPRGCGKTSSARILAKALNCQNEDKPTATPCCTCTACTEITKGSSMDVIEIDGASNTSVNDVRQIKDEVQFPPNSCRYKIYIIDEVHMLSTSAFNALLKTIEEPPPYVIFIFATTELQKVPATIKSRCQQFNFRLVPVEQVKNLLATAAKEINIQAEDEALYWIARESTGSIRDAYTLFDQVVAFCDGYITYEKIRDKLGLVGVERLNSLFEKCAIADTEGVINMLDEYLQSGISIEQLISNSADYLRSLLLLKSGVKKESLLGQSPERYSAEILNTWSSIQIERALSIFLQLYRDIRYSLAPRYEIELAFSRLCWLKEYVSPSEVKKAIDSAKNLLISEGAKPEAVKSDVQKPSSSSYPHFSQFATGSASSNEKKMPQTNSVPPVTPASSTQGSPHSLPVFSALSTPKNSNDAPKETFTRNDYPERDGPEDVPPDEYCESEDEPAPFHNGGDMPPEKTMSKPLSAEDLKQKVVKKLTDQDNAFIASALMQVNSFVFSDDTVIATVDSEFKRAQLERQNAFLCGVISEICSKQIRFHVELKIQEEQHVEPTEIPKSVDMVCKMFRGTIVGGKI